MRIYDVQVNHLTNPLGFFMEKVRFSWKIAEAMGKKQESARVMVAADGGMTRILLDTGFDPHADSLCFPVALALCPRTRYYFTISVRSDLGEEATSRVHWFETGKQEEAWQGKWIACENDQARHPIFEKLVEPKQEVVNARLYICGLGLYEAFWDGEKIGDEYLTPYCNNYNRWMQYQTYDVTAMLEKRGKLSILLGNGWYKGRFGFAAREEKGFYGDAWKLIAELRLTYRDGSEETIGTDESWTVRRSKITFSSLYDGEHRDDTLPELPEERAVLTSAPRGRLMARMSTPVTVHETFEAKELLHTPKGELVLDMGQEFTGTFRLRVHVPRGQLVRIQTGELLQDGCFYNANLRTAKSEYRYISDGSEIVLEPHFTFYGFRYVKIDGIPNLKREDFAGLALYSHIQQRATMRTGHELVNKLLSNITWGLKSNFLDVPTDCPQRDERMGWTGDAQVFSATATFLRDTYSFYAKYLYDMYQEQLDLDGKVPDVVPSFGVESCACAWGDAACIIPWNLYCFYGDKQILEDQYESMKAWVDYISRVDGDHHGWREAFHYGDWLALDNMNGEAEQVLGATDEGFLAGVYYAASAEILAKTAGILGDRQAEKKYSELSAQQFASVREEYYSPTGRCCIKTQTALLLTLKFNLSSNRTLILEELEKLFRKSGGKLTTGFVGTPLLCGVLSDNGMEALAWRLLLNEDYPGWLHEVKLGATTVWERWNSVLDNGTISGTSMNSLNHYAYGSVAEWLFRGAAGFGVSEESPGCRHLKIRPLLNWQLREQETVFDSPSGTYRSYWRLTDPTHVCLRITVPFGCTAELTLPCSKDGQVHHLLPGTYCFDYEADRDFRPGLSVDSTVREIRKAPAVWEKLRGIININEVPLQYLDFTLRQIAKRFGDYIDPERLEMADAVLEGIRKESE